MHGVGSVCVRRKLTSRTVYLPCMTPINVTIQLDDRTAIPLHPLDLFTYHLSGATSDDCVGVIQTPKTLPGFSLTQAYMILGVPFLRNTYTVMAYDPPNAHELTAPSPRTVTTPRGPDWGC